MSKNLVTLTYNLYREPSDLRVRLKNKKLPNYLLRACWLI